MRLKPLTRLLAAMTLALIACQSALTFPPADDPPRALALPSPSLTPTVTATPRPTQTLTGVPSSTPTQTPSPTPTPPPEHFIEGIRGHHQYFALGCETAAALDWARFLGYDFNEFDFQYDLPRSDNPELGFVGDVDAPWGQVPPYGYGVYAGPVADLLNAYGIPALAVKGASLEDLRSQLAADRPVIAWVIGNMVGGVPSEYVDQAGNSVTVAAYEHVVILTGYSETNIRYMNNGKFYEVPQEVFLNSWDVLGDMAIVVP